jgi:hypothetical protein
VSLTCELTFLLDTLGIPDRIELMLCQSRSEFLHAAFSIQTNGYCPRWRNFIRAFTFSQDVFVPHSHLTRPLKASPTIFTFDDIADDFLHFSRWPILAPLRELNSYSDTTSVVSFVKEMNQHVPSWDSKLAVFLMPTDLNSRNLSSR